MPGWAGPDDRDRDTAVTSRGSHRSAGSRVLFRVRVTEECHGVRVSPPGRRLERGFKLRADAGFRGGRVGSRGCTRGCDEMRANDFWGIRSSHVLRHGAGGNGGRPDRP